MGWRLRFKIASPKMSMQEFSSIKSVRAAAALTTSYVAGTVIDKVSLQNQLVLLVQFTLGSLTDAQMKIEFSEDGGSTYFQETIAGSHSSGVSTIYPYYTKFTASGNYRIPLAIKDRTIKVSVIGTGNVSGSSMQIDAITGVA